MTRLVILFLTIVLSVLFTRFEWTGANVDLFLLSDDEVMISNYIYYLSGHVVFCLMAYLVWDMTTEYKSEFVLFFWLSIGDTIDYLLRNSHSLGTVEGIKITYDAVQMLIFGLAICKILWTR